MTGLKNNLLELIRRASTEMPEDVSHALIGALRAEEKRTTAEFALKTIRANIELAAKKSQPICQDTGAILFYIHGPIGCGQPAFEEAAREAVADATRKGLLRQNSVDSLTGRNSGTNLGPGTPTFHFTQARNATALDVRLILKGGGCENVGAQYSLPDTLLGANRDLKGCRRAILDAVLQAQGKGCGPGVLGVCIGGDRATGYAFSKEQLLRPLDDRNPNPELAALEQEIVATANQLGIGPMGFGGRATLLGCKICAVNRLPASYFVSISYMCWAFRRRGVVLSADGENIERWIY